MKSQRVLAFLVLAVFPPAVLMACGGLFGKDADAGADAAVVVSAEPTPSVAPVETAAEPAAVESAAPAKVVVVNRDGGTKVVDAGSAVVDAGKIPTPNPDAGKIPNPIPGGLKIPSGFPSSFGSLKIPSGFPKLPNQ